MNTKLAGVLLATLTSSVLAQGHLLTPAKGTATDGPDSTFIFGWAANQGHRFMDYSHTGTRRALKAVSFRADYRSHNAIGRTWSKVTVHAAHGDWSSLQYNKSAAYKLTDTPTKVFDAKWSFPALKGRPAINPDSWGGIRNLLSFRFKQPWAYNGKDAIFLEFRFSGGVADNNVPWVGGTPKGFEYYLDSMPEAMWRGSGANQSFPSKASKGAAACVDSGFKGSGKGKVLASYLTATASLKTGAMAELGIYSYYTSQKNPVIYALGLGGNTTGFDIGTGCTRLYLDFAKPTALLFLPAPNNKAAYATLNLKAKREVWMTTFWVQAGWADTATKRLLLTNAVRASLGKASAVPAATSYVAGGTRFNVWTSAPKGMPYMRYEY